MYNMSLLHHRFLNERGGGALNHLPLLFCNVKVCTKISKQSIILSFDYIKLLKLLSLTGTVGTVFYASPLTEDTLKVVAYLSSPQD